MGVNTAEDIAKGIQEVLKQLEAKLPSTKILLLGLLPIPNDAKCKQVRNLIQKFGNEKTVFYLDMSSAFQSPDGKQKSSLFKDGYHAATEGYIVWHQTMEPLLVKLLQ